MRVLYFGTYEREYPRNALVISCLRGAGVEVVEHQVPVWEDERHKLSLGARRAGRLVAAELRLARASADGADVVVIGYPGHADMLAAGRVAGERPVVLNPLVSLEDTVVGDRGLVPRRSARARALHLVDRFAFRRADLVVADTDAHGRYFADRFGLEADRVITCFVGADDGLFRPAERAESVFEVLFVGKLIPLHGLETILEAARRCPEVRFRVVGSGQLESALAHLPENVVRVPWIEYTRLPDAYLRAGCALGVFGTSDKAARVIPNKVFQALATRTPVVTADTPAARELLADGRDALLVPPGDAEGLARAVVRLRDDPDLRARVAANGRSTYEARASEAVLGSRWSAALERLVAGGTQGRARRAGERPVVARRR